MADYTIHFDGGSKGNPGLGYGSYKLTARDGQSTIVRKEFGDNMTNNVAEYRSLLAALVDLSTRIRKAGQKPGEYTLLIRGDSALVLGQSFGTWQVKAPHLLEYRDLVRTYAYQFKTVMTEHVSRDVSVAVLGH